MELGDIWKDGGEMDDYLAMSQFANENGYIFARNDGGDFEIMEPASIVETPEQLQERYAQAAQDALDTFAKTRNYDGIMSVCSYSGSTDPQFAAEAAYCMDLRDHTWRMAYAVLDDIASGTMELPTVEKFIAMLPVSEAEWPEAQGVNDAN